MANKTRLGAGSLPKQIAKSGGPKADPKGKENLFEYACIADKNDPQGQQAHPHDHKSRVEDRIVFRLGPFKIMDTKYSSRTSHRRLEKLFKTILLLVGRKFKYSQVDREDRSRDLKKALELLWLSRVAHKVSHTAANGIPLGAEINAGALCEQFIGQHLIQSGESYDDPSIWSANSIVIVEECFQSSKFGTIFPSPTPCRIAVSVDSVFDPLGRYNDHSGFLL